MPTLAPSPGLHKSAVLLAALGTDVAARVLSHMKDTQVEVLIREMTGLGHVPAPKRDGVVEEFHERLGMDLGVSVGGLDYARSLLEQALGPERAGRILDEIVASPEPDPDRPPLDAVLEETPPERLASLVVDEHPQLIALLMSQLPVEKAAVLLSALPSELQGNVTARLAQIEAPSPVALQHLERCITEKLRSDQSGGSAGGSEGPRKVADILGRMRRSVEESLMAHLEQKSPELAQQVSQYRFTFEDLLNLDARGLQRILREIDADTLRIAMKGLDDERQQVIYTNMSERAANRLREDLENTGPTRLRDVEVAQQMMVATARALAEKGELQLNTGGAAGGEEETFV